MRTTLAFNGLICDTAIYNFLFSGAIEKQKFVFILNRDGQARLTISSPLEAHKSHNIVFHTVGIDVGFENPMFACLELDYEESDIDHTGEAAQSAQQTLTFYELDLGLNHVVRKYSEPLEESANLLISGKRDLCGLVRNTLQDCVGLKGMSCFLVVVYCGYIH